MSYRPLSFDWPKSFEECKRIKGEELSRERERQERVPLDPHTGRDARFECICLRSAHPHCPQHGDSVHRRNDIPSHMVVDRPRR